MNYSGPSAPPVGDKSPTTPPLPSVQTSPQPQQIVIVGSSPPVYVHHQQPTYVYVQPKSLRRNPTPLWLDIVLIVSGMLLVLGQLLCLNYVHQVVGGFHGNAPRHLVGYVVALVQMSSGKVVYQVLYLMGVILVLVFGLMAAYSYDVGSRGWQLMLWGIIWWSVDIISYGILCRYSVKSLDDTKRYYIIYLVSVGLSCVLFIVGWAISFNTLFSRIPGNAMRIGLHICTLITAIMTMLAPMLYMVSGDSFKGIVGCIVGLVFIPVIYGTNFLIIYLKEKKIKRNNDFVVDPNKLSVSVEAGKVKEANAPLIVH
jgi:hypothetical protein